MSGMFTPDVHVDIKVKHAPGKDRWQRRPHTYISYTYRLPIGVKEGVITTHDIKNSIFQSDDNMLLASKQSPTGTSGHVNS